MHVAMVIMICAMVIVILLVLILMKIGQQQPHLSHEEPTPITTTAPPSTNLLHQIQTIMDRRLPNLPWKILHLFVYNQEVIFLTIELDASILYFTLLPKKRILLLEDYSRPPSSIEWSKIIYLNYPPQ